MSGYIIKNKGTEKGRFSVEAAPPAAAVAVDTIDEAFDYIERQRAGPLVRCSGCEGDCPCMPDPDRG